MSINELQKQNDSRKTLIAALEKELTILRAKDYSFRKAKIANLEAAVDSERAMNAQLTQELERLEYKWP